MRAIVVEKTGGPEAMTLVDLPDPVPGDGQALIRVEAAGVNFVDTYHRSGLYPMELPIHLGREGAGVVEDVGPGVRWPRVGERVCWADVPGSYATHVLAPATRLVSVPSDVPAETAAAVMLQGMMAHCLTRSTFVLRDGDVCLVHAAAGGVGLLLCQMARDLGARVIGTTSTEEKAALARENGASDVVLYTREDFAPAARRLTGGAGVAVVYDGVGKDTFTASLDALRVRGTLVLYGAASGPVPPFDPIVLMHKGSLFLTRPTLAHHITTREELVERAHDVLYTIARGKLSVRIGDRLPLADAAEAHRRLQGRGTTGKLLLIP